MSILIKGMAMPKDKEIILRIDEKGEVYNIYGSYPTEPYSVVELPPHGRLIDADALMKDGWMLQKYEKKSTHLVALTMPLNCSSVPIIIEAEESNNAD